jgi:neutral amino acid transport system ATP-binding protein
MGKNITGLGTLIKSFPSGTGHVPQSPYVFPSLSIEENLKMGAFTSKKAIKPLKERIYAMFPRLDERRRQKAGTLSGGERQMLAMGRALMLQPDLLILDEPSGSLISYLSNQRF